MSIRSIVFAVVAVFALVACGPSSAQVKAARTARYKTSASEVFQAAVAGLKANGHTVANADAVAGRAMSKERWYEGDGTFVSKDADGKPLLRGGEVVIVFETAVVPDGDTFRVEVIPHVQQFRDGYAALFQFKADDPSLPGFIAGLVDNVYLSIHGALKGSVVTPGT